MNIPPFWSRVKRHGVTATGWSFTSAAEAEKHAGENCIKIAHQLEAGGFDARGKHYYADHPVREPIIREFRDADGKPAAVVTRNGYGCCVLNAARLLFVDVDSPEASAASPLTKFVGRLFGRSAPPPSDPGAVEAEALANAEASARRHAPWLWRVYRTKAGLRFLAAHAAFDLDSSVVRKVFDALGADPLYRNLCTLQKCFRARLTPKPWRCGYTAAQMAWPFLDADAEARFKKWETGYADRCRGFRTCELLTTIGSASPSPALRELIAFHDETTQVTANLPLA
jgi:hypothetical protein